MKRANMGMASPGKKIAKTEMKTIIGGARPGGYGTGVGPTGGPNNPSGGGDGYYEGCFKCCWDNSPTNCSLCVYSYSTATCQTGASLMSCGPCSK